jgi:hypothetical protein
MPDDNITRAFKEIGFGKVEVEIANGEIVSICAQVIQQPERAGVRTQHTIEKEITK